jgi:DNA-directed RNA polymerase specialized sigma24 family protein
MSPNTVLSVVQRLIAVAFLTLALSPCWSQVAVAERAQLSDTPKHFQPVADYADHLVNSGEVPGVVILVAQDRKIVLQCAKGIAERNLVKLRYFGGLTAGDAAKALGVSPRTADRLWGFARSWLFTRMQET